MCELFALSSALPTKATFSLEQFASHGGLRGPHRDGWGLAFYDGAYAQIFREPEAASASEWMRFLQSNQQRSTCVISHIRLATQGEPALRNTQPFSRELGGRRHVFCHNGDLKDIFQRMQTRHHQPIGETDSEYAFCCLMDRAEEIWSDGAPTLERRIALLKPFFDELATMGQANFLYADGEYLYAYANKRKNSDGVVKPPGLYYLCRRCEQDIETATIALQGMALETATGGATQEVVLFASVPLSDENWRPFEENQMIVCRDGKII